ncbi:SNF2 family N-terminal domain-containing protein [Dactylonectria estremocensis]|uniref:SNF2 family N-terminal domain-containing protein n=1 Tax=Dactylonectria estremocensis TaxID=1079267 RepID=A0A9P9FJQ4_9HYPO|nr:SNF2 family N-terminal domain-containing protein [Dactylonectria estremocensis]
MCSRFLSIFNMPGCRPVKKQRRDSPEVPIKERRTQWDEATASLSPPQPTDQSLGFTSISELEDSSRSSSKVSNRELAQQFSQSVDITFSGVPQGCRASQEEVVCFGELNGLIGKFKNPTTTASYGSSFRAHLNSSDQFSAVDINSLTGKIDPDYTHLTYALLDEPDITLQVTCSREISPVRTCKTSAFYGQSTSCLISIIIYGPFRLFDEIGVFFQTNEMYLQDPKECDRNVRYYNPHRLSSIASDHSLWTFDLQTHPMQLIEMTVIDPRPDLLDVINSNDLLPETSQPSSIRTSLKRHQKQALTFMQQRELGWALDGSRPDIWEYIETGQNQVFVNGVSGVYQEEPPENFYGGIIGDPMGLGKTLTIIALVATDNLSSRPAPGEQTLVVVPPALLGTWEEQLSEHVVPGNLSWCRHHGKTKLVQDATSQNTNIVLTTFNTVSAEWRSHTENNKSVLFSKYWKRLVLDEAHIIRNSASQMARSVCALQANCRWAVTGTPIQNRLSDLAALLQFLRVDPYMNRKQFDSDISNIWKNGDTDEAIKRLKRLAGCLILRRKKTTISLPSRRDLQCPVEFTVAEREVYNEIRDQVISRIDYLIYENNGYDRPSGYVNVLQQIEAMRMVCNLGLYYCHHHKPTVIQDQATDWKAMAQPAFNFERETGAVECQYCPASVDVSDGVVDDLRNHKSPLFSQCLNIVFSNWRTTLDVLEAGLNKASIETLRFDGKVPQKDRQSVLDRFRNDPNVRVLLLTLSCGAVGLTLTAASYAFLMEPHWNPTLEDQALARIHRLGQKREVTTVRFYVRDSFEQRVIEVQESKRQLAGVLLTPHDSSGTGLDMRSLQNLRSLL